MDTNKYSKWVFTLLDLDEEENKKLNITSSLPKASELSKALENLSDNFVYQLEKCPTSGRLHVQGYLVTKIRKRQSTVLNELIKLLKVQEKQVQIDRMQGTIEQAREYCTKEETRVGDSIVLSNKLHKEEQNRYKGNDLDVFKTKGFYPWQSDMLKIIFEDGTFNIKASSSREVLWVEDITGNNGKSLFTKYLCYNNQSISKLAFGSGSQMRSAVVEEGPHKCYIIDIPRKLCNDDHANNIYSVIEDLKNGFIKSSMYGKPRTLFMEPPLVIIFANFECPTEKLSVDRWKIYSIIHSSLIHLVDERRMDS